MTIQVRPFLIAIVIHYMHVALENCNILNTDSCGLISLGKITKTDMKGACVALRQY